MAVFTPVSLDELSAWITQFSLGRALAIKGISSGIENSNFFITTDSGEYVLTLFEKLNFAQLPFYLELMRHLAQRQVLVPEPIPNQAGSIINALNGKPASIVGGLFEMRGQRSNGGKLEKIGDREFALQLVLQLAVEGGEHERIGAEIEEVVVHADGILA